MTSLESALRAVKDALRGRPFAVVGGLAVSVHGEARTTRDVDVTVACIDDDDAEGVVFGLQARGWTVFAVVEQEQTGRLATVRVGTPGASGGTVVDLLFASCGVEAEITASAEPFELFPGLVVPVATRGDLIAMKVLSRDDRTRPRDLGDLRSMLAQSSSRDRERAAQMLAEIECRGFQRGRKLTEAFQELLHSEGLT